MINKARAAVVDCRASQKIIDNLKNYARDVILMPPFPALASPVASHPDMLVWSQGNRIFTYQSYVCIAKEQFNAIKALGYQIIFVQEDAKSTYPDDVHLNCATVGQYLIANKHTVSRSIITEIEQCNIFLLHTNQGYAKCSICKVSDNAIITADRSIHKVATAFGIDSLLIREGDVRLDGYDHGFIGGASGNNGDHVFFCGDITAHPDGDLITNFVLSHGKQIISLSNETLHDFGTVMFL